MIHYIRFNNYLTNSKTQQFVSDYMETLLFQIKNGYRKSHKGTPYSQGTITSLDQMKRNFQRFEYKNEKRYQFDEIDYSFINRFVDFLYSLDYSINTVSKNIRYLNIVLSSAMEDGVKELKDLEYRRYRIKAIESDAVYLTRTELKSMMALDLSKYPEVYGHVRDVFFIGTWTAQRFSDYCRIKYDDIISKSVNGKEISIICVLQKKTGKRVLIPCSTELKGILEKYDFNIPHVTNQVMNKYIKEIARMAGINEDISVYSSKGGRRAINHLPKWKLIQSHTARRTGATLMYLSGMDIFDIMQITGHSTPGMLKKYIKADGLEVLDKMITRYTYFD